MRLNNRGFAIVGILYTLYVLFLLILLSVLGALSVKKRMLEQYTRSIEESYQGKNQSSEIINTFNNSHNTYVAGKYIFQMTYNGNNTTNECSAYLKKGLETIDLKNINYTTKDCNTYKQTAQNIVLKEIISFEESDNNE